MSRRELPAIGVVIVVGTIVRLTAAGGGSFPLNDGGLFYQMVVDLRETFPALPASTGYNGLDIPYAYPPLAFYLGALLYDVFGGGLEIMRALPLVGSILTVPAFYLLARSVMGGHPATVFATGAFALMPRTFEWLLMGGGLTRSLGLLLAILALWQTHRLLQRPSTGSALAAGCLGGLTVLAHPEAALFALVSGLVLVGAFARSRRALTYVAAAVGTALIIVAPWLVAIASQHGLGPIVSASATQPGPLVGLLSVLSFEVSGSRLFDVLGLLAAVGALVGVLRRRFLVPTWLAAVLILDARGGGTYASVPAALLAGSALWDLAVAPLWQPDEQRPARIMPFVARFPRRSAVIIALVFVAALDALGSPAAPDWRAVSLSPAQVSGIEAVGELSQEDDAYLVVEGKFWPIASVSEWFPVISGGSQSVATVQGWEWLGRDQFRERVEASEELVQCAQETPACIEAWSDRWQIDFTHVFIPKGSLTGPLGGDDCCVALRDTLAADEAYRVVYDGPGASIFERERDGSSP